MSTQPEMVTLEEAKEQVRIVSQMLGRLHIAYARTIVDELGEKKGKKLILKAIKRAVSRRAQKAKEQLAAEGREPTFENRPSANRFKYYGMLERREDVNTLGERRWRAYGCAMGEVWRDMGEGELGHLYCYVDPFATMTSTPEYTNRHERLLCRDGYCEGAVRKTTEHERQAFASEDGDLESLDNHL